MVSEPLAAVLRSGRSEFNRQFAEARRVHPNLDGAGFAEFLRGVVDPFIREIARVRSDAVTDAVMVAYEIALELAGQKLVGTGARSPLIEQGWQRVLVAVAGLAAASPARVLGAVSNALHNLASIPGARGEEWIEALERLGPKCPDVDALLRLGQVLAWKAGLAHFRAGAITAADALPTSIALAALGAPQETSWPELRERLLGDPWFDPAEPKAERKGQASRFRVMAQAGAFRGFGGLFVAPPRVARAGDQFLVSSGEECWLLTADLFGATFHRANSPDGGASQHPQWPANLCVDGDKLLWRNERFQIPSLGKYISAAANETTLALTSELTHSVVLIALR